MSTNNKTPTLWQQIQWPVIILALLGGHAFIMLVAMTFAFSAPPLEIPEEYGRDALNQPQAGEIALPNPKSPIRDPR